MNALAQMAQQLTSTPHTQRAQVRMCGNSVCPPVAAAIVRANAADMSAWSRRELRMGL